MTHLFIFSLHLWRRRTIDDEGRFRRPKDQPPSGMAQMGDLNDRFSIIRELEHRLHSPLVDKIKDMTRINVIDELLKEKHSLYGSCLPRNKYRGTQPKIHFIELGLVNEVWINRDDVPDNFPAIIRYICKNVTNEEKWLSIRICSTVASRYMEKFYQPYQIWDVKLLSPNPVQVDGCECTTEDVLAIDPLNYQVDSYRLFLKELNEFKLFYECGVGGPTFFDGRRIISIGDVRIRLNLESKLGVRSNYLDVEKLRTFWNVCRSTPDFPYDVQVAVAGVRERFESLSLRDFMYH
ncbi:hypothetical protein Dimus_030694 [Dionaea muscipula]